MINGVNKTERETFCSHLKFRRLIQQKRCIQQMFVINIIRSKCLFLSLAKFRQQNETVHMNY